MKKGVIKRLWAYVGKYRFAFIISLFTSLICVAGQLYLPILFGKATDLIVGKGQVDLAGIVKIGITGAISALIAGFAQWITDAICTVIANGVVKNLRKDAFEKLQKVKLSYLDKRAVGDVLSVEISDTEKISEGLLLGFSKLFTGVMTIVGTLIFMITINPIIALVVVVLTPVSLFVAKFITGKTYKFFKRQSEISGSQTGLIEESISNLQTVKAYSMEEEFTKKFSGINDDLKKTSFKAVFFSSLTNPCTRFVNSLVYSAVAFSGAMLALYFGQGLFAVTAGSILALLSYANRYTKPDAESEVDDGKITLKSACGNVKIKDVSFSYSPDKRLIEGFNLNVSKGQKVAIVGPTGCGKTTLINLLMRFYEIDDGLISVDGIDVKDISKSSLRTSYGMVLQDTWIRNATVKDNIKIGNPSATDEDIITASKKAHAHGFIKRLEKGYDTKISENSLSQGQKQLLCIARVMLSLPEMLILDEATSSIDTRTEMKIQSAFDELTKDKTSFIVAHRLSTIKKADVILVMKDGNVIEQGSHEQLLKQKGVYYQLYHSQFAS